MKDNEWQLNIMKDNEDNDDRDRDRDRDRDMHW